MPANMQRITWIALAALVLGLLAGAAFAGGTSATAAGTLAVLEPIGTIWINAVRMTIMPLVISMLIVAVASSDSLQSMGRLGGAALLFFIVVLGAVALLAALLGPVFLRGLDIDPASATALRETATASSTRVTETVRGMGGFAQRVVELVPPNPFRSLADGAMLPLIVFALVFGAALSRLPAAAREAPVRFFGGVSDAMLVIVRWVFMAAPVGVFALAVIVGARLGYDAVGAVAHYVVAFAAIVTASMVLMYVMAALVGRAPLRRFAGALAPAQVIAIGSRSSSAALPAMIEAARDALHLPPQIVSFVLPSAVAIFRATVPVSFILGALFLAKLYGIEIGVGQVASLAVLSVLLSFSVPPLPSGSLFLMAPVFADLGIPVEGIGILIAIDAIPDIFKTTANVTADMASAVVVARLAPANPDPAGVVVGPI